MTALLALTAACTRRDPPAPDGLADCEDLTTRVGGAAAGEPALDYELVSSGCDPPALRPGAAAGSPCQVGRVCADVACTCPVRSARFSARVCAGERCLDASAACAEALRVAPAVCGR